MRQVRPSALCALLTAAGLAMAAAPAASAKSATTKSPAAKSQAAKATIEKVTSVEGITEYRLSNGLQVLLFPDPSKPTVTVNITYLVGSRHEGRGEAGMAHLLEHMVFKGTPTYPSIWGAIEDHGGRFNGTTWTDRTNYFETLPASDENLKFALHMEADRMVNSTITAEDLAKEFSVVRNEFERGENNPVGVLEERMVSAAYLWHNYGKSTIGNRSDIERVPASTLRQFYEKYYQPDNAMLVVAGKFEPEQALALIVEYFGAIPRPERKLEETYTVEPPQDGAKMVRLERVGDVAAAGLVYHVPPAGHRDFAAVEVLAEVLTAEPSGRLYKALVETGKVSRVYGYAYPWREPSILLILSEMQQTVDAEAILAEMTQVVEGIAAADITDEEVERVKTRGLKDLKLAMADSGRIGVRLSEYAAIGDWRMLFISRDWLKEVTTADVKRVAGEFLIASNRTAGAFIPSKQPERVTVPEAPDVAALTDGYVGTETIAEGEAFDATPANIDSRTARTTPQPGMKLALLEKETRGDAVRASLKFHFGTEAALKGQRKPLELVPAMLMRGTTSKSFEQLKDAIDQIQSRVNVTGGVGEFSASIESDRANIVAAIELLGEILRQPGFDADQFAILHKEEMTGLEEGLGDPQARGFTELGRMMSPFPKTSIHYVPSIEEEIAELKATDLAQVKKLYSGFYGASNVDIAVVGDFDPAAVKAALTTAIGDWKSPAPYARIAKPFLAVEARSATLLTPDKKMATVGMGSVFAMRDDHPDYPAMEFASYILGQSAKSRLLERLRQKDGLSYGAGGRISVSSEDERATIMGFAICAPQNAAKAQQAMREEIEKWIADGVTEEELSEGKSSWALQLSNRLSNDARVAGMIADDLHIDRTMQFQQQLLDGIQKLTTKDVGQALETHLGDKEFCSMKAGDLENVDAKSASLQPGN